MISLAASLYVVILQPYSKKKKKEKLIRRFRKMIISKNATPLSPKLRAYLTVISNTEISNGDSYLVQLAIPGDASTA